MSHLTGPNANDLYEAVGRVAQRSESLKSAKVAGASPVETIIDLVGDHGVAEPAVLEVGPGRGSLLAVLRERLAPRRLAAMDRSTAMLASVAQRVGGVELQQGDMHRLPWPSGVFDVAIAAFVLYHSATPEAAARELLRVTSDIGILIVATKSADSYKALDELVATAGIDRAAATSGSLYSSFCAENAEQIIQSVGRVCARVDQEHRFHFLTPEHAAAYAVTVPKYSCNGVAPATITPLLAKVWPPLGLEMRSTVSYLVATKL